MAKAKEAPESKLNVCEVTVKWYGDNGKPFGFVRRADGIDLHLGRLIVEEAQEAKILSDVPRGGDTLKVVFKADHKGMFVAEILAHTPAPEVCGHVIRITKEAGHAIVRIDGTQEEALVFERLAKREGLEIGDEVMAVLLRDERGIKAEPVRKTGNKVELAPARKLEANHSKAEKPKPKKSVKHGGGSKKLKVDTAPEALLRDVFGIVKSFNPQKGFGFITLEVGARTDTIGPDVFVCYKAVERTKNLPEQTLYVGDMLQFDVFPGREAGKVEAQNLRYVPEEEQMKEDAAEEPAAVGDHFDDSSRVAAE